MTRITMHDITEAVKMLNAATHIPAPDYKTPGSWLIGQAYGGFQLERVVNEGTGWIGGVRTYGGYGTKRDLLARIHAMLDGIRLG